MLVLHEVYMKKARMNSSCLENLNQYNVILWCILYWKQTLSFSEECVTEIQIWLEIN